MSKQNIYIVTSIFLLSILASLIDIICPNYFVKILIKILLFLVFPSIFFILNKNDLNKFKQIFIFDKNKIIKPLLLGITVYIVILLSYFFTKNIIDFSNVTSNLTNGMGITANNFIYVSLYIAFMNSFLEEFFFRGYGFIILKKYTTRKFAYIFSPLIFAIYHIGMLNDIFRQFSISILLLIFLGLIIGGYIFNYLNEADENIYSSWFVHMFANFAINTIGLILFGILP